LTAAAVASLMLQVGGSNCSAASPLVPTDFIWEKGDWKDCCKADNAYELYVNDCNGVRQLLERLTSQSRVTLGIWQAPSGDANRSGQSVECRGG
jgi:hypothetical protein